MSELSDLYIVDAEYLDSPTMYVQYMAIAEDWMKKYRDVVFSLRAEGIFLGEAAETLEAFASMVLAALSDSLTSFTIAEKDNMIQYITEVNEADEALY